MRRARANSPASERLAPTRASKLSLQSFLPYRLNALAQTVSDGFAVAYWHTHGISPPEWRVLATLGEFERMSARDIGKHSGMHKTRISRAVLALERRRLVVRAPSVADRREEILALTPAGRSMYETIAPSALHYQQRLLEGLSPDERTNLDRLIRHLMERASAPWEPFEAVARPARRRPSG